MIKVVVLEEQSMDDEPRKYWVTTDEISSEDQKVIAMTLRAIADRMDPPRPITRST